MASDEERGDVPERRTRRGRVADYLSLERSVVASSAAFLLIGMGEELWKRFLPKYLEALGAGALAVGLFGTTRDFFDAVYQYPGGWAADRLGRRRAFLAFLALASVGYLITMLAPSWPLVFVGLAFMMAWAGMASPALFAVIGDALPAEKRAMGFTLQSMLKRVPSVVSPLAGGALITAVGVVAGVRAGLLVTLALAALAAAAVLAVNVPVPAGAPADIRGVWRSFRAALKRLLVSDVIIRTCEGMTEVFVVLYVTNVTGVSLAQFGALVAVQMATSILVYVPSARIAERVGRKPFVVVTFLCFALFPLAVVAARSFGALALAFVVGGLREIGEPSRKALIVDFAEPHLRARTVGLYYLVRSLTISPAALAGGLLWKLSPQAPFLVACAVGLVGTVVFALTVEERDAG